MLVAGTVTFRVFAADIVTVVNPEYWNALKPILVTEFGIVIDVKMEQPLNAKIPILVTELGIVIDVKIEQS
jgi:hypothetical protein